MRSVANGTEVEICDHQRKHYGISIFGKQSTVPFKKQSHEAHNRPSFSVRYATRNQEKEQRSHSHAPKFNRDGGKIVRQMSEGDEFEQIGSVRRYESQQVVDLVSNWVIWLLYIPYKGICLNSVFISFTLYRFLQKILPHCGLNFRQDEEWIGNWKIE